MFGRHFFFNPHELTKIVLQSSRKFFWSQIESFGLANRTKKVFPVFPCYTVPGETQVSLPHFNFFGIETFFEEKYFLKGHPFNVFGGRIDVEKSQRAPLCSFFSTLTFFPEKDFLQSVPLQLFDVLQQWMLKNPSSPPLLAPTFESFQICNVKEYLTL